MSPATRARVMAAVRESGYSPNVHAQRLLSGRSSVVALCFGNWPAFLSDMYDAEVARRLHESLAARGYGLLLSGSGSMLTRWVESRAVDGVIFDTGSPDEEEAAAAVARRGVPCVAITTRLLPRTRNLACVAVDLQPGPRQVARLLVDLGHRRIGFVANADPYDDVQPAFREALCELGAELPAAYIRGEGRYPADGCQAALQLLDLPGRPTAIFARTDSLALGVLRAARRRGLRVPHDLSVVGHDDLPIAELADPPLTTLRIDCAALGVAATELLMQLLKAPGMPAQSRSTHADLVLRESVAPPA